MLANPFMQRIGPAIFIILLTGCTGISPATHFHTLDPTPVEGTAIAAMPELALGLGPIALPEMLKRPQLVIRESASNMQVSEFHRWAGDLEDTMTRTMARQLMQAMGTEKVAVFPWPRHRAIDYQIRIDVLRFDGALGGEAVLAGTWTLADGDGRREITTRAFSYTEQTAGGGHSELVQAMSRLLARLSAEAAAEMAADIP
jgi:uncharacterized lipoprotein YmbA